ncbi:mitochondrial ribosomal subunit protein-domain-containing protein [Mycotypha africana]|uniref:mitochondrial ribosomal subunit protein-domain-containing protein n=1 Tax=Mycotypha africana TaxID=64632 RepID=UPI0023017F00|nr:mitochondrial ribosomal subunit protein-domain-containing protein [Mycotypha africana]KAI8982007.1 mitochondrial ribosomal subunit protein-domain-containing protein [Mycotypha africana]
MLRQAANLTQRTISQTAVKQFSTSSAALVGRQTTGRRKPAKKYDVDDMPKFNFDDQTTIGHELFNNIREVRKYLRKTEFELPKLSAYAKPFEPPKASHILKFKTHTYVGEGHPVERKVVLSVKVDDLKLDAEEKHKFLLLSGPRYNVNTGELTMSCERFPQIKQNKKFLIDALKKLVKEAKDKTDTFADVPLNLPKPKQRLEFPKEWIRSYNKETSVSTQSPSSSAESAKIISSADTASSSNNTTPDDKTSEVSNKMSDNAEVQKQSA